MQRDRLPDSVCHFSAPDAYLDIFRHGLRSTRTLLRDFEVPTEVADRLTSTPRRDFETLGPHPRFGIARLAHNGPLLQAPATLDRCLELGGCTLEEYCRLLADRVFFWVDEGDAEGYRANLGAVGAYDRIRVRTSGIFRLAEQQGRLVEISPHNSGSTPRSAIPRGRGTWTSIDDATKAKELVVVGRLDGLAEVTTSVTRFCVNGTTSRIWAGGHWE